MKQINYLGMALALILLPATIEAFSNKSFMTYRTQGLSLARFDNGWQKKCMYDFASLAIEYTRSFDNNAITQYFLGSDQVSFSGSRVTDRNADDIMADYFGLPTDFQSTLNLSPRVQNAIVDLNFYWNLPWLCDKLNVWFNIPIVKSKWALNPCETIINPGNAAYPAGYMSTEIIEPAALSKGALDVLSRGQQFGDLTYPLQFGRISQCTLDDTKIADIIIGLGYNFICNDCSELTGSLHTVVPTGTCSESRYLFEPQIGNGHHWALGINLSGRYDLLVNDECGWSLAACFDGYVQHLFATHEMRSYDLLNNGAGSRYMLLEDMVEQISITQGFSPVPLTDQLNNQYITRLFYVVDATTLLSKIRINAQGEFLAQLKAQYNNWNFSLGYNLWGRTKETLVCREAMQYKSYGVKGDAQLYGFLDIGVNIPLPLNATQSNATIHSGQGASNTLNNFTNNNADNAALIYNVGFPIAQTTLESITLGTTGATILAQVNGSNQAVILSDNDINNCSGLSPRALTNSIFGSISYSWDYCNDTKPYLLIGCSSEFATKVDCAKTAISQWGIWVKGGINY